MAKASPSVDECLLLINLKRAHALAAMRKIVAEFGLPPHRTPSVVTVLEYLNNMVYCIELMLKFLSDDWRSHKVGKMYEVAFGHPHPNQALMDDIKTALVDQKYLFQPSGGLIAQIEDFERLHDEVRQKVRSKRDRFTVKADIPAPASLLPYLRDNAGRFHEKSSDEYDVPCLAAIDIQADYERELKEIKDLIDAFMANGHRLKFHQGKISLF